MKKLFYLYILCGMLTGCLLAGCGTGSEKKKQVEVADSVVYDSLALRVGYVPTLDVLPLLVAQENGLVDSLHLDLVLTPYNSYQEVDSALVNGQIHVALTDLCRAILLNAQNDEMKVVSSTTGVNMLVTQRQLRIRRLSDMPERMVAIVSNEGCDWMVDQLLEQADIQPDAINRPQIFNLKLRAEMVRKEMIDAAILPEPYATEAAVQGDRVLGNSAEMNLNLGCMVIPASILKEKKDDLDKLARIYNLGVTYLNQEDKCYDQLLQRTYGIDKQTTDTLRLPVFQSLALPDSLTFDKAAQWMKDRYTDQDWLGFRVLSKNYKLNKLFDSQLIHE